VGYSGLIYAVIVAGWAALLAPRWIRRNEEIERAREADAARGVRVLERRQGRVRGGHVSASARALGRASFSARAAAAPTARNHSHAEPAHLPSEGGAHHTAEPRDVHAATRRSADGANPGTNHPRVSAAARRRRTLMFLTVIMTGVLGLAISGTISVWWTAVPFVLLWTFVLVARRAVVLENRRARAARIAAHRRELAEPPAKRVAVYVPETDAPPDDSDAWTPRPVPRPTYLSKPKASPSQARRIDLSGAGSWTSGRLDSPDAHDHPGRRAQALRNRPGGDDFGDRRAMGD
jgi:hypothetical protein